GPRRRRPQASRQQVAKRDAGGRPTKGGRGGACWRCTPRQRAANQEWGCVSRVHDAGNVINTTRGPLFVDLETVCRGPLEFDLAHVPRAVSDGYPSVDQGLPAETRAP